MFVLGLIVGVVLSLLLFLIELYLVPRKKGIIQRIEEKVRLAPKGKVIFPKTDEEVAQDSLIESNAKRGEDTKLEDLGL